MKIVLQKQIIYRIKLFFFVANVNNPVIRANDLLLKDVKTARFIRGQNHELEYVNISEEEEQEVTFALSIFD